MERVRHTLLALTVFASVACVQVADTDVTVGDWRSWVEDQTRTQAEAQLIAIQCYREQGWEVSVKEGTPGLEGRIPEGQWEAFLLVKAHCEQVLAERGHSDRAFGPQDIANFYGYMVDRYQCLVTAGFDVPPPPALEVYLETYHSSEDHWNPYGHIPHQVWREAVAVCPQNL